MPELGKATYFLILDSQQFNAGLTEADAAATKATTQIGQKLGVVSTEAQTAAGEVNAAGTEMAAGFEKVGVASQTAATEAKAGAGEVVAAADTAAAGVTTASASGSLAWNKMGSSIGAMGTRSFGIWKLAGLAAVYEVAKGGIHWLSDTNKYTLQLNNALAQTHNVADTSTKDMLKFSDSAEALATEGGRSSVLQLQAMLLGFTNIRNEGPKAAAIFDRVRQAALDISTRTGRSLTTVAVALGKAFQDPVKYMNTLGRAGVTFNKQQQTVVATLIASGKPLQAQEYMLQQLARYSGAAGKQAQSFAGQWRIARGELEASSAKIVTAFIPAFKSVVGILVSIAGFLSRHTTLVKDVTIAYIAWKAAALGIGIAMKLWNFGGAIAGFLGMGTAAETSAAEANTATVEMSGGIARLEGQIALLNKQLLGIGVAAETGAAEADAALVTVDGALATVDAAAAETDVALASTGVAGAGAFAGIGAAALGVLGPIGLAIGAVYLLDKALASLTGFDAIKKAWGSAGWGADKLNEGMTTPNQNPYQIGSGAWVEWEMGHGHAKAGTTKGTEYGKFHVTKADVNSKYYKQGARTKHKALPGEAGAQQAAKHAQAQARKALNPKNFSQSTSVVPGMGDAWTRLEIAYSKAQMTKGTADDKKALQNEEDFLRNAVKNRHLSLTQKQQIWAQIASINGQIQSLNVKIKGSLTGISKILGPQWAKLDIAEQKAKGSQNLEKDKKALMNEEDFLKNILKNRQLSLANRQKIDHQLTAVEDKIAAINKKMKSSAQSSQQSEIEAFNELQGSFFGQFAPNIFGGSPGKLTLGSQRVKAPQPHHHARGHAMGGVIGYARGGAVDTRIVREAPHYASTEARYYSAGRRWFEHNAPSRGRGTDTVPAMLTPGELVLNASQQRMLRSKLGIGGGSPEQLFSAINSSSRSRSGEEELIMKLTRHQISMSRAGSSAPYRKDISTWLRQFSGMSTAQKNAASDFWGTNYGEIRRGYMHGGPVGTVKHQHTHHHTHTHKQAPGPPLRSYVPPSGSIGYIQREARRYGLDPRAVLGVASGEGLGGGIGDRGTSFGPWQLHKGGAYPRWAPQGEMAAQRWAWSKAGIDYAMSHMAHVARGLRGSKAAMAIINRFERPANPMSDYRAYQNYVGSHGMGGPAMKYGRYSSPFAKNSIFERIDQGVDYMVKGAVHAVGAGRISSVTGGMAGGTGKIVKERLDHPVTINGRTYYGIYYSEGSPMVKSGSRVRSGQNVMGGGGVEIGFLNRSMQMPPLRGGLGAGTKADRAGIDFSVLVSDLKYGKRVGFSPGMQIGQGRKVVKRGNRYIMIQTGMSGAPWGDMGISGLVPGVTNPSATAAASAAMDTVPAMLTPGEMVLNAQQQELLRQKLGLGSMSNPSQLFSAITNPQHFYTGGVPGHSTTYRPSRHVHHPHHVSAATAHHHPETQRYGPVYHPPHVSAATAHHHPDVAYAGPVSHATHEPGGQKYWYLQHPSVKIREGYRARGAYGLHAPSYYMPAAPTPSLGSVTHALSALGGLFSSGASAASGALGHATHVSGHWLHQNLGLARNWGPIVPMAQGTAGWLSSQGHAAGQLAKLNWWTMPGLLAHGHYGQAWALQKNLYSSLGSSLYHGVSNPASHPGRSLGQDLFALSMILPVTRLGALKGVEVGLGAERAAQAASALDRLQEIARLPAASQYGTLGGIGRVAGQRGFAAGLGAMNQKDARIWDNVLAARDQGIASGHRGMWGIPDAHLWRGGNPLEAIHHVRSLARQYRPFGHWYDAIGQTNMSIADFEGILPEQYTGAFSLLSPKNRVAQNLRWGVRASQIAKSRALTIEDMKAFGAHMGLYHKQAPRINELFSGARGIGHSALGIPGDILFKGPKVPSFNYNQLHAMFPELYPDTSHVTIDAISSHALVPGLVEAKKGIDPYYRTLSEIYRQVAKEEGFAKGKQAQAASWVPHSLIAASMRRGGLGRLNPASVFARGFDFLEEYGKIYGQKAKSQLIRRIQKNTAYGAGMGVVSGGAPRTPLSKSWDTGVSEVLDDWSGAGALNAGVFHVKFGDNTTGVIKFLKEVMGDPEHKIGNEILQASVAHLIGANIPDMMQLGDRAFASRTAEGPMGYEAAQHRLDEAYHTRAGHRLGLLDILIGNSDRHGYNFKLDPQYGAVGFDADLLFHSRNPMGFGDRLDSTLFTEYDYRWLDRAIPRLQPTFGRLGRHNDYNFLWDQWKDFRQDRFALRSSRGQPLTLLSKEEMAPFYAGRVFPGVENPDLRNLMDLAKQYRSDHGIRGGGYSDVLSYNRDPYRVSMSGFDPHGGLYNQPLGTDWTRFGWTHHGGHEAFGRRSQLFSVGDQMNNFGFLLHDRLEQLRGQFSPDDPFQHQIDMAQRDLRGPVGMGKYPHSVERDPMRRIARIRNVLDRLGAVAGRPFRQGMGGAGQDAVHMRGVSMLGDILRDFYHYKIDSDLARHRDRFGFSVGGAVPGSGQGDTVPAMLTPGELVLNSAQQVMLRQRLGLTSLGSPGQLFAEIAGRRFAAGGIVEGLDWANIGVPSPYTSSSSLGYNMKRDISRMVGVQIRAREVSDSSPTGTLHYEQHNTYHELPKDQFAEARQMKQAVHASFQT